jgi:hypothetical protein
MKLLSYFDFISTDDNGEKTYKAMTILSASKNKKHIKKCMKNIRGNDVLNSSNKIALSIFEGLHDR